jgi:hypothetical protein
MKIGTAQDLFYLESAFELSVIATRNEKRLLSSVGSARRPRQACVVGAVTCSVSFLECTINGLYEDAFKVWRPTKFHESLKSVWSDAFDRQPILAKYQLALALARREPFKASTEPYQSAAALIEVRNAIAHPKEMIASDKQQARLEGILRGKYIFAKSAGWEKEFFPDKCLSPECAAWAVKAAVGFALEFHRRLPPTAYVFSPAAYLRRLLDKTKRL